MAIQPSLQIKVSQSLKLTPQVQQSIRILELAAIELAPYLQQVCESNVFLNMDTQETSLECPPVDESSWREGEPLSIGSGQTGDDEDEGNPYDYIAAPEKTLREHLVNQLHMSITNPVHLSIALVMIDALDEAGYLGVDDAVIAEKLSCDPLDVRYVRETIMSFDPIGVGARDLKSCLKTQLRDRQQLTPALEIIIDNLQAIAQGKTRDLQSHHHISTQDIQQALVLIRQLNPRPALAYGASHIFQRIPDVHVMQDAEGQYFAKFNSETLPKVWVDEGYFDHVLSMTSQSEELRFIKDQMAFAKGIVKMLEQRIQTILRVTGAILKHENDFLQHGIQFIKALNLRTIAEELDLHESTVSRAIHEKYMLTPRGLFAFKYFFSSQIQSTIQSIDHSATFVKHRIKQLIENENKRKPLSDERIVKMLMQEHIAIARRTVTKYREMLKIPPSSYRRMA